MANHDSKGLLGDTPQREYGSKIELFQRFAEPELRRLIEELGLHNGDSVLDAGCGSGLVALWLAEQVTPQGRVVGVDLAGKHIERARQHASACSLPVRFLQANVLQYPIAADQWDWIWCSNTINHFQNPLAALHVFHTALRSDGHLVLGQSAFLPDMFFAWDFRLEKEVMLACRQYYRDKYGLEERDTTAARNLYGWMLAAGFRNVTVRTIVIERTAPLTTLEETYFLECVFRGYWSHRVRPYLDEADWRQLERLCDPESPDYCLCRPDFHHLQTFSLVTGQK